MFTVTDFDSRKVFGKVKNFLNSKIYGYLQAFKKPGNWFYEVNVGVFTKAYLDCTCSYTLHLSSSVKIEKECRFPKM